MPSLGFPKTGFSKEFFGLITSACWQKCLIQVLLWENLSWSSQPVWWHSITSIFEFLWHTNATKWTNISHFPVHPFMPSSLVRFMVYPSYLFIQHLLQMHYTSNCAPCCWSRYDLQVDLWLPEGFELIWVSWSCATMRFVWVDTGGHYYQLSDG